jgi:GT2 family glycosyltransferase
VILADSLSTDRTVDIAQAYPIRIVQLNNRAERRCGVGPQLGYQWARGEYVYILDGDMELDAGFLPAALAAMEDDPRLGGVAGLVEEQNAANYQFRGRQRRRHESRAGAVRWLDMGGLYRRRALRDAGYFSNRNLHAFEEQELGLRLTSQGWRLKRLDVPAVRHYGYSEDTWALLRRRWRSRYLDGSGEILRAGFGRRYFWSAALQQKHLILALGLWLWLIAGALLWVWSPWVLLAALIVLGGLIALRAWRIGNLADALRGQIVWQISAIAMLRGLLQKQADPCAFIDSRELESNRRDHPAP